MSANAPEARDDARAVENDMTVGEGARLVVAIDGPAASGKSSTAKWVAERLGVRHVDSGSLYRAATAAALRSGIGAERWSEAFVLERAADVVLAPGDRHAFVPLIGGAVAEEELRGSEVTRHVSRVAQMPGVRAWVNAHVRAAAEHHDVVVDGRDIGTAVFPDASLKVFLVADPWAGARPTARSPTRPSASSSATRATRRRRRRRRTRC